MAGVQVIRKGKDAQVAARTRLTYFGAPLVEVSDKSIPPDLIRANPTAVAATRIIASARVKSRRGPVVIVRLRTTRAGESRLALMVSVHFNLPASTCGTLGSTGYP